MRGVRRVWRASRSLNVSATCIIMWRGPNVPPKLLENIKKKKKKKSEMKKRAARSFISRHELGGLIQLIRSCLLWKDCLRSQDRSGDPQFSWYFIYFQINIWVGLAFCSFRTFAPMVISNVWCWWWEKPKREPPHHPLVSSSSRIIAQPVSHGSQIQIIVTEHFFFFKCFYRLQSKFNVLLWYFCTGPEFQRSLMTTDVFLLRICWENCSYSTLR